MKDIARAYTTAASFAVEADAGPLAPPAPVAGAVLAASARPNGDEPTSATLSFNPSVVLPSQSSQATAVYTLSQNAASGLPLTLVVEESLTLLDDSVRRQAPYRADLILYRAPDGTPAGDTVLFDETPIKLDLVVLREGVLEIGFTEEPDAATLSAIQLNGAPGTWTLSDDRYSLTAHSPLEAGSYTLSLATALEDINGNALAQAYDTTLTLANEDSKLVFEAPEPRKTPASTIANPYGFQGLPKDPETGVVNVRLNP